MNNRNDFVEDTSMASSSDNYLTRNYVMEYLNDSVQQLLEIKNSNPKIEVLEFFTDYFKSVIHGNHILFRDYSFISSTPHNRACFIQKFFETYSHMITREDPITINEYHALIMLLSFDFPLEIVENSSRIGSNEENPTVLFKDFIYIFQFQFYFKEFINDSKEIYYNYENFLDKLKQNKKFDETKFSSKKLTSKIFIECLDQLADQATFRGSIKLLSLPSKILIKETLSKKTDEFDFYNFLKDLAFNETLIRTIGKLPTQDKLFEHQAKIKSKTELIIKQTKDVSILDKNEKKVDEKLNSFQSSKAALLRQKSFSSNIGSSNINKAISDNSDSSTSNESSSDTDT